jgi:hypothetical protein
MKWFACMDENNIVVDIRIIDPTNPNTDYEGIEMVTSLMEEDRTLIGKRYNGETLSFEDVV